MFEHLFLFVMPLSPVFFLNALCTGLDWLDGGFKFAIGCVLLYVL